MLSILVVVHNMPRQAENTLFSLSVAYQKNVTTDDYEVIVVENRSDHVLGEAAVLAHGSNFRYLLREESGVSPAPAVNAAFALARGEQIGLIIDGARMVTPRVIEYALMAHRMTPQALVMVPGYHLGTQDQKAHQDAGHSEELEIRTLQELDWKHHGYRLFRFACFSSSNQRGYFQPMQECNALFCSAEAFRQIGAADERFDQPGGGSLNLHLYRSLGLLPGSVLFVLPGEGSFHQFHGGVTTAQREDREALLAAFKERLDSVWEGRFRALTREPVLLGSVTQWAQAFLKRSCTLAEQRFARLAEKRMPYWVDDAGLGRYTENDTSDTDENRQWRIEHVHPPEFWM